jgi:hypothetical protein
MIFFSFLSNIRGMKPTDIRIWKILARENERESPSNEVWRWERILACGNKSPDNNFLTLLIIKVEIQHALFQMHPNKSPSPDGFNMTFYQRFWEELAFVQGRSILNNVFIVIEVIHALKRKTQGRRGNWISCSYCILQ